MDDRLQRQRFELKFRIRPETALAVRDFVRCHLELDEFGATQPDLSYDIHSVYLDSDDLRLYQSTINGDKNRYKLRLRTYEERPDAPVFFEIKRRVNNCILKRRARVKPEAVPMLLDGAIPVADFVPAPASRHLADLQAFCELMWELRARPRTLVSYRREAWVNADPNGVRVTFDRAVRCEPHLDNRLGGTARETVPVFRDEVVLELKFTDRFPAWLGEMVRAYNLVQSGAAKYVDGLLELGGMAMRRGAPVSAMDFDVAPSRDRQRRAGATPHGLVDRARDRARTLPAVGQAAPAGRFP